METATPVIKRRVDIPSTLLAMKPGTSMKFRARTFAPYASVRSAISRINSKYVDPAFVASTDDNGVSFTVTRK